MISVRNLKFCNLLVALAQTFWHQKGWKLFQSKCSYSKDSTFCYPADWNRLSNGRLKMNTAFATPRQLLIIAKKTLFVFCLVDQQVAVAAIHSWWGCMLLLVC